jgi:hypothetical protein
MPVSFENVVARDETKSKRQGFSELRSTARRILLPINALVSASRGLDRVPQRTGRQPNATLCAVTTFITPVRHTSKRILNKIDEGEQLAMQAGRLRQVASG